MALYARVGWPWILFGWVGLVPWLAALDRARSWRAALGVGTIMCVGFGVGVFGWFASAIQDYTGAPWIVGLLCLVVVAPLLEPQFLTAAVVRYLARRAAAGWWRTALITAGVYVGTEWALPKLFADTLGHGLYASAWMRQAADLGGAHGLTVLLLVANDCVLALIQALASETSAGGRLRRAWAPAAVMATVVAGLLTYGGLRYAQFQGAAAAGNGITAGIIQADLSHYDRMAAQIGTFGAVRRILDTHFSLSTAALGRGGVDLLVWPETVYPTTFGAPKSEAGAAFDREIGAFVTQAGVPLVFGAYDADGAAEYNAAFFLEPALDRHLRFETYRKAALFPLTEHVPALLESSLIRHWLPWLGTWQPGTSAQVVGLTLRDGRRVPLAPLICYDAVAPGLAIAAVRQGAELIVTLSNDSWFAYHGVPRLILIVSAFRSIETRRAQVRATNTGISAVITASGDVTEALAVETQGILIRAVRPERTARTLMLAWGDWCGRTSLAVAVGLLAWPAVAPAMRRPAARRFLQRRPLVYARTRFTRGCAASAPSDADQGRSAPAGTRRRSGARGGGPR